MAENKKDQQLQFKQLYERYGAMVHRRCLSILHSEDEAWDATQEVFMKLHKSLATIEKENSIYSWLLSASTNHCISELRKRRTVDFNEEIHSPSGHGEHVAQQDRALLVREVLRHFLAPWDSKVRQVIMYAYFDGYKQEEISQLMGIGESTIRKHLTRFKRKSAESGLKFEEVTYG